MSVQCTSESLFYLSCLLLLVSIVVDVVVVFLLHV